jgi:hypothetical protein
LESEESGDKRLKVGKWSWWGGVEEVLKRERNWERGGVALRWIHAPGFSKFTRLFERRLLARRDPTGLLTERLCKKDH